MFGFALLPALAPCGPPKLTSTSIDALVAQGDGIG
jgi:hypothetical protein